MKIKISVRYRTATGESVVLCVGKKTFEMSCLLGEIWYAELSDKEFSRTHDFTFNVISAGRAVRKEWRKHTLRIPSGGTSMEIRSHWQDRPGNSVFWSSAFTDVIFARREKAPATWEKGNVTFVVNVPEVRSGQVLAIAGSGETLGGWDKPRPMSDWNFPTWSIDLEVKDAFEYKFLILDAATHAPVLWEEGPNHLFAEVPPEGSLIVLADNTPSFKFTPWKGAGVAVPVFSLRSENSFGIGEFNDIPLLVDWAVETGQSVIQLLPVNDTTMTLGWEDSYPYNANSSFALHPQFLHLPAMGIRQSAEFKALKEELNSLDKVDYERVNKAKFAYARKAFAKADLQEEGFKDFVTGNASWLLPYAAYCVLRDKFGTADFSAWGKYSRYSRKMAGEVISENRSEADFYCYLQYQLDIQLREAVAYAHSKGVILKGDLPIGISRVSCDAWSSPELFHMDSQAGAPPDAFAVDGQNWGFPTYNWEAMAADGFSWWKSRLRKMSEYFNAFRIDHILGFFRIWEIPLEYKSGLMGHFNPALPFSAAELLELGFEVKETGDLFIEDPSKPGYYHPRISAKLSSKAYAKLPQKQKDSFDSLYEDFFYHRNDECWRRSALSKLPELIDSTGMLACGEDLGMIPACVPETMSLLNILSLEIQRMPKAPGQLFGAPSSYPYLSVCSTGTHDMSTIRAWWEEDRDLSARYFREVLGQQGEAPYFCEPWVCECIVRQHLRSNSILTILPLQDWLSVDGQVRYQGDPADERINVPSNSRHYWRYRMHCTLESLIANKGLSEKLRTLFF